MVDLTQRLHGWGYEGRDVQALIDFAQQVNATVVVDVRLTPISRRYGFSKRRLSDALATAWVAYLHLPALGNPRDNRPGFAEPATPAGDAADHAHRETECEHLHPGRIRRHPLRIALVEVAPVVGRLDGVQTGEALRVLLDQLPLVPLFAVPARVVVAAIYFIIAFPLTRVVTLLEQKLLRKFSA